MFYFGDYQGTRQANGVTNNITIPSKTVLDSCTVDPVANPNAMCNLSQYLGSVLTVLAKSLTPIQETRIQVRDALHLQESDSGEPIVSGCRGHFKTLPRTD